MEFLGIGPLELLLILVIALIVMGPNDMVKTGRTIGKFLRQIVKSPTWQAVQQTSRDLRYLPNKLMREAGMEEEIDQLKEIGKNVNAMAPGTNIVERGDRQSEPGDPADRQGSISLDHLPAPAAPDDASTPAQEPTGEPVTNPLEDGNTDPTHPATIPPDSTPDNAA